MAYRVSTNPAGERRWWLQRETIPTDHTNIRAATPEEAKLMDRILAGRHMPSEALGKRLCAMLAAS